MQYFLIVIFIWFLLSSISINIKNIKRETDILLSFGFIIKLHLDYDKFMKRFNILNEPQNLTIERFNNYVQTTFVSKDIYDDVCKHTIIKRFKLYKVINIKENIIDIFSNTLFLITTNYISNYINNKFKEVKNELYEIQRDDFDRNEFDFEIGFKLNVFWIIVIFFKNIKTVKKIIKINRSERKHGPSNSYVTKGKLRKHKGND